MQAETAPHQYQGASEQAIQHHYDVGNEFYRLWLDATLTYSCALWDADDTLEAAQTRKIDYFIDQAKAANTKRVLEVGCGWGSTLKRLVGTHGVERVVGLTLSEAQADWIKAFNEPRIEARIENWFDHVPDQAYDAIISIAAFEAFARFGLSEDEKVTAYRRFFERCHQWLKPGGRLSMQTIIYENFDPNDPNEFVSEIFPESDLPRLTEIAKSVERLFEITTIRNDRDDYTRTLREWHAALRENRSAAVECAGEEVVARYEKYLGIFTIGFHTGTVNLSRITLQRIDRPRL